MIPALYIVTGSSRGLGRALLQQLLLPGHRVLGIARHADAALQVQATAQGAELTQWTADLIDPAPIGQRLAGWLNATPGPHRPARAYLFHNAGVLGPPGPIAQVPAPDLAAVIRVGLESALVLTGAFLAATEGLPIDRRVMHISSGLGRRAMAGGAAYGAAKAGLDHFCRCVALEEAARPHGARVSSVAPGVIDTDMQRALREADPARFADQPQYALLAAQGQLISPAEAAARLLAYLHRDDFGQQPVSDIRQV